MKTNLYVLLFGTLCTAAAAADWPRGRGPDGDGMTAEHLVSGNAKIAIPEPAWRRVLGEGCGSVVTRGRRVCATGWQKGEETLWCLNADDGAVVWTQRYRCPRYGRHAVGDQGAYSGPTATPTLHTDTGLLYTLGGVAKRRLSCDEAQARLSALLSGDEGGGEDMEAHLAECALTHSLTQAVDGKEDLVATEARTRLPGAVTVFVAAADRSLQRHLHGAVHVHLVLPDRAADLACAESGYWFLVHSWYLWGPGLFAEPLFDWGEGRLLLESGVRQATSASCKGWSGEYPSEGTEHVATRARA